jgi:hypothetical protein
VVNYCCVAAQALTAIQKQLYNVETIGSSRTASHFGRRVDQQR